MGRILIEARLWNFDDDGEVQAGRQPPLERQCVVDTGSTETVLPRSLAARLGLRVFDTRTVRYASGRKAQRELAGTLVVEIAGRKALAHALVEPGVRRPLIGATVLESLDLVADCKGRRLVPNPDNPDGATELLALHD